MDYVLAAVPKPYIAVMDGITSAFILTLSRPDSDSDNIQWVEVSAFLSTPSSELRPRRPCSQCQRPKSAIFPTSERVTFSPALTAK